MGSRQIKKGPEYYIMVLDKCQDFISENEILTIPSALEAIMKRKDFPADIGSKNQKICRYQ